MLEREEWKEENYKASFEDSIGSFKGMEINSAFVPTIPQARARGCKQSQTPSYRTLVYILETFDSTLKNKVYKRSGRK